jgi:2-iminobutanoate/2-iminopropanoate deaminase
MGRTIQPDGLFDASDRLYSQARIDDGVLSVSGQVGWDEDGELVGPDVESQTTRAFENVRLVLEEVEEDLDSVTKVTSYFTAIEDDFAAYKRVWDETFDRPYPAHTALGVEALAEPELCVEIEVEVPLSNPQRGAE